MPNSLFHFFFTFRSWCFSFFFVCVFSFFLLLFRSSRVDLSCHFQNSMVLVMLLWMMLLMRWPRSLKMIRYSTFLSRWSGRDALDKSPPSHSIHHNTALQELRQTEQPQQQQQTHGSKHTHTHTHRYRDSPTDTILSLRCRSCVALILCFFFIHRDNLSGCMHSVSLRSCSERVFSFGLFCPLSSSSFLVAVPTLNVFDIDNTHTYTHTQTHSTIYTDTHVLDC